MNNFLPQMINEKLAMKWLNGNNDNNSLHVGLEQSFADSKEALFGVLSSAHCSILHEAEA